MSVAQQLLKLKKHAAAQQQNTLLYAKMSPMERAKLDFQEELARQLKYRITFFQKIKTFSSLSVDQLQSAAENMELEIMYKGDIIIQQEDVGDFFCILQEGQVRVTKKKNIRDASEVPKLLATLGSNTHFGDISLITDEVRSATITVISDTARVLKMTKDKYNEILSVANRMQKELKLKIGKDIVDRLELFKTLSAADKKRLQEAMAPMTYLPGSYICHQGYLGNTFYIITEGTCSVTLTLENGEEKVLPKKLYPGDFFGEVALTSAASKRTANVVSDSHVSCLSLNRAEFNRILKSVKMVMMEHQALRGQSLKPTASGKKRVLRRRITCFDPVGRRSDERTVTVLRRIGKYMSESLWNSLYSRYYRDLLVKPNTLENGGIYAKEIMEKYDVRPEAVEAIALQAQTILNIQSSKRSKEDNEFIAGLLSVNNNFKDKLCKGWPKFQFKALCKKVSFVQVYRLRKVIEIDTAGTNAFLILKGAVRLFTENVNEQTGKRSLVYEEDLFPGDYFGEAALGGVHHRYICALAMTHVELISIEDEDFSITRHRGDVNMTVDERFKFLSQVPLLSGWEPYKLYRLSHVLHQEDVEKGVVLSKKGQPGKSLNFIVHGRIDVLASLNRPSIITSLQPFDYFDESSVINKFEPLKYKHVCETTYAVAFTRVELLVLPESAFETLGANDKTLTALKSSFVFKQQWRSERQQSLKGERKRVKELKTSLLASKPVAPDCRHNSDGAAGLNVKHNIKVLNAEKDYLTTVQPGEYGSVIKDQLDDLEDIPRLLNDSFDPFLITGACRNERDQLKAIEDIAKLKKPKSAVRPKSAANTNFATSTAPPLVNGELQCFDGNFGDDNPHNSKNIFSQVESVIPSVVGFLGETGAASNPSIDMRPTSSCSSPTRRPILSAPVSRVTNTTQPPAQLFGLKGSVSNQGLSTADRVRPKTAHAATAGTTNTRPKTAGGMGSRSVASSASGGIAGISGSSVNAQDRRSWSGQQRSRAVASSASSRPSSALHKNLQAMLLTAAAPETYKKEAVKMPFSLSGSSRIPSNKSYCDV